LLNCSELHGDVEPIQNAPSREPTAVNGFREFTGTVADDRHPFIAIDPMSSQEVIQPRRCAGDPLADVGVQLGLPVAQRGAAGNNIDLASGEFPWRTMLEPRRFNAHSRHPCGFAGFAFGVRLG
jgi:hypothetical protein